MAYYGGAAQPSLPSGASRNVDYALRTKVKDLQRKVHRLELEHRVLWELVREGAGISEQDLQARARAIDTRDGVQDGKITDVPLRCPSCKRVSSSKHWKCLYCGQDFEQYAY